jgi:magnesium-transporting ATPase (P-type)
MLEKYINELIFSAIVLVFGICGMITLFGGLAILWGKKISIQPEQHSLQQNQGFNTQAANDTILNVIGIIYVTLVLASILIPAVLISQNIITPHPLFMVHNFYILIYVPSLLVPITFAIIRPKSIKIGIQTFPCFN